MAAVPTACSAASALVDGAEVTSVVQPIVRLDDRMVIGFEALARVGGPVVRPPDWWLRRAEESGLRGQLEVAFLTAAARLGSPPGDALLFVNVSPAALAEPAMAGLRSQLPERLVVEITEQAAVDDYTVLRHHLETCFPGQVRLAIDDTGAGYSSLRHVVELSPDFLKLDRTLVHDIDKDGNRHALVRALVAFAREVGTSVVAEGVETRAELAALIAAEVPLAQGYLLGRPAAAWPTVNELATVIPRAGGRPEAPLRAALAAAHDVQEACEAVVGHLFRQGQVMPSLYLERNGQLRCVAQRGLWQVLDGLPPEAGVTGRVWATGEPTVLDDVAASPQYLEAIPGVVAEVCVPVKVDGVTIGALNIDSLAPLPSGALRRMQHCADLLSRRLATIGWRPEESPWQLAGRASVAISGLTADADAPARILGALLVASGMDSGGLVLAGGGEVSAGPAIGPLAPAIQRMPSDQLESLCGLVDHLSSCYTGRETTGVAFLGTETLRSGGARAVLLLPLRAGNVRLGTIILANSRPMCLDADVVEPLELLAGQAAAVLSAVGLVERLRYQAHHDGLTGLRNRVAFDVALDMPVDAGTAVLIADVDHFKQVNDRHGHLAGDEALRTLALELNVRLPGVPFYRFGGDELTCLLAGADVDAARRTADAVCSIGRRVLSRWGSSLSVGVAVSSPGESPSATLARADTALFWTKRHVRGQATVALPDQVSRSHPSRATA